MARDRAFTLIETLVTIGVIAVVMAITLPAVRIARSRALDTQDMSNLRQSSADMGVWSGDHQDVFPNGGGASFPFLTFVSLNGQPLAIFDYWDHSGGWPHVLHAHFGERSPAWEMTRGFPTTPIYSLAMVSDPRLWDDCPTRPDRRAENARQVRWSEVAFPASKGLLVASSELFARENEPPYMIAMVDGSVATHAPDQVLRGAYWELCGAQMPGTRMPVIHTIHGVFGRDVRD